MNCFFSSGRMTFFSMLIVQYYCSHGLFCLSESPANIKLVVLPGAFLMQSQFQRRGNREMKSDRRAIFLLPTTATETKKKG